MSNADPRAMIRDAMLLEKAGRFAEAEAAYEHLLARWPDLPDCWFNLAVLQRKARRFDAALQSYQQALDRGVSRPEEVHLNRGVIYSDHLRREAAAADELQSALSLNPRYVPALLNLANLHEDLGRPAEALALYERLLDIDPAHHAALARFASLRTATSGVDAGLVERLQRALARADVSVADRASLGFALGLALDQAGAYDAAFNAYVDANRASRASAGQAVLYDRRQHERLVDELITTTRGQHRGSKANVSAVRPIFICGMFRSGSTLAEQVLSGHSRVTAGGEIDLLPTLVRTELTPFPSALARVLPERARQLAAHYLESLARLYPGAEFVTDKRPDNFLHIGLIKTLFPDARIVHTLRNPADNCLSIFFLHLDHRMGYALDLADIGHYYEQYRRLMSHWRALYGDDILDFDYDGLVREPRPAIERLLEFCGLDWEESCLAPQQRTNAVKTASVWQVRQPLYQHSSGRARHYARHLAPLAAMLENRAARSGPIDSSGS